MHWELAVVKVKVVGVTFITCELGLITLFITIAWIGSVVEKACYISSA